ncbi:hypothetical protein Clacol_002855 [Clathrus columnatus]|uniref:GPI anchored protein n=1 Tax=Clathrus columnatus TaxID=1419009 RepID=A0AAV5A6K7_9AGAM|nr:hypothetical protein Clacol_002855 [Clathrus columnatus]
MQLITSLVFFAIAVVPSLAQSPTFQINSPEMPNDEPFIVAILPTGQTGGTPLIPVVTTSQNQITFTCGFGVGDEFTLGLTDKTGFQQFTSPIPVVAGPSTTCNSTLSNSDVSSSSGSTGTNPPPGSSSSSGASSNTASPSSSSTNGGSTKAGSSSTSTAPPSGSSTSTTPPNGAVTVSTGGFGFLSLLVAALLA